MPTLHHHYNKNLKLLARELRKNGTKGEALLWKKALKARNIEGYQFNRQFPIDEYIVDFLCRKLYLIIEIDGSSHISKGAYDRHRQEYLENLGYTIIRFSEDQVIYRMDDVISEIVTMIKSKEGNE
ncbi:MAG: endonuclease domain-containing protein [Bacteroidetes bacterium]|nr:endonuclease domain-containing protein [Bacteroidota bacterium]